MTKQREIELLDEMIHSFGPDSYLGPWLKENRDQIVADIHNDLTPAPIMPSAAHKAADIILKNATDYAKQLGEKARADAEQLTTTARDRVQEMRENARRYLMRAAELL